MPVLETFKFEEILNKSGGGKPVTTSFHYKSMGPFVAMMIRVLTDLSQT